MTKDAADAGSTRWAQGGVAVVVGDVPGDSVAAHVADTLTAGGGLCDEAAAAAILRDGPAAVARLRARGAVFDADGGPARPHPGRRALGVPGDPRGRRRDGRRDRAGAGARRGRAAAAHRARRRRRAARTARRASRGLAVLDDDGAARRAARAGRAAGHRRLRAALRVDDQPRHGHRRRRGARPARRGRGGRPGVRAVPPDRALHRARRPGRRPLVTEAVRGEGAVLLDRAGAPLHGRRAPAGRPGAARRRRRGDHPADGRDRAPTASTSTPARSTASPRASRRCTRRAGRPGSTRCASRSR